MDENLSKLQRLISRHCDGTLTSEESIQLRKMLREDEAACRIFLQLTDIHARLCWNYGAGQATNECGPCGPCELDETTFSKPRGLAHSKAFLWSLTAAAALVVIVTAIFCWKPNLPPTIPIPSGSKTVPIATLERGFGVRWADGVDYQVSDVILPGELELLNGLAVLRTASGAQVTIEAPAHVKLIDAESAFLFYGRVVVHADTPDGYVVDTNRMKVVDKGTEFGVSVQPSGEEVVQVFSGRVLTDFKEMADTELKQIELTAGEAYTIAGSTGSTPERLPFAPERFVRTFPEPSGDEDFEMVFQTQSRVEAIGISPAPSGVIIDGDLSDWDRRGGFIGRCDPPYDEAYHVQGVMMYDEQFLYIGAHVRDPSPMRSVIPPEADSSYYFRGGSVQVRFSADPGKPWPLPEYYNPDKNHTHNTADPADLDSLVHLGMWYSAVENQPCLQICYGIPPLLHDAHHPAGWEGAYRKDDDGQGYTMEYAIPWKLIRKDHRPFRAGDATAVCWQVNWADRGGHIRVAQLNECVNLANIKHPNDLINCWCETASWGRANFLKEKKQGSSLIPDDNE